MKSHLSRVAFQLMPIAALSFLSACAARPGWVLSIDHVGPTYVPAIDMQGTVQRVVALEISGSPELVAPLLQEAQADGWKARLVRDGLIQIDPMGHSIDEVMALNFRVENGEFGELKTKVVLRPDGKKRS